MKDKVRFFLSVVVAVSIIAIAIASIPECKNGTLVRGVLWYECIK